MRKFVIDRMRKKVGGLLTLALIGLGVIGFSTTNGCFPSRQNNFRNVILISLDTCRADHLGCYWFSRNTTPNIDAMAREALIFKNALSPAPLTLPAHSTLMTGTNPPYHGVRDNLGYQLNDAQNVTLAETLKANGFTTAAFVSSFILDSKFGLSQGFDTYQDDFEESLKVRIHEERRAEETTRLALEWLDHHFGERFFLFLHYYDPHDPYRPPQPYSDLFADDLYSGEIAYMDDSIGKVFEKLKSLGIYESSLIIVAGDHGEDLGEHEEFGHGYFLYQVTQAVPLIIKVPGFQKAKLIEEQVGLIDVLPTVLSLLGIAQPEAVQGEDLSPYLKRQTPQRKTVAYYCEALTATKWNCNPLFGLVQSPWKLIHSSRPEIYDLGLDPLEKNNLHEQKMARAKEMKDVLTELMRVHSRSDLADNQMDPYQSSLEKLRLLGYVGGAPVSEASVIDSQKEDPKDFLPIYAELSQIETEINDKEYEKAKQRCLNLAERRPDLKDARFYLGLIALDTNDYENAVKYYRAYIEDTRTDANKQVLVNPMVLEAINNLAGALYHSGNLDEAQKYYGEVLGINPDQFEAHNNLGVILARSGNLDEAVRHCREALRINPNSAEAYCNLGIAMTQKGLLDEAIEYLHKAITLEPDSVQAFSNLGHALEMKGDIQQSIQSYEKALQIVPNHTETLSNLGLVLLRTGRLNEAAQRFRNLLQVDPESYAGRLNLGLALYRMEQFKEAIPEFEHSLRQAPQNPVALYYLGKSHTRLNQLKQAVEYLQEALKQRPKDPAIANDLAWILVMDENGEIRDDSEALRLATLACELTSYSNPSALDTLAITHYRMGKTDLAIQMAEKALTLSISDNQEELTSQIRSHLDSFKSSQFIRPR